MQIVDLNTEHLEDAAKIAKFNYEEERSKVSALPEVCNLPDLNHFADNNLGVAAIVGRKLVGYLGAYFPQRDAFGTTNVMGTFSPIQAHGATGDNRDEIYLRMYQAAAKKWVKEGILSHAIACYAHDKAVVNTFFYQGFGLRCIDAIREMEDIQINTLVSLKDTIDFQYMEIPRTDWSMLLELNNSLIDHIGNSPVFMKFPPMSEEEFLHKNSGNIRYYGIKDNERYIAYIKITDEGENFATFDSTMRNICGAFCMPEYRGLGIYQKLLSYLITSLKNEGYARLGVDFESFNPNARGFWLKYFTEYTNSLVRRIDDKTILK